MEGIIDLAGLLGVLVKWMYGLIPTVGILMISYHAVMKSVGGDEQQAAMHARSIRTVLTGTALGLAATGLIHFLGTFIKPPA